MNRAQLLKDAARALSLANLLFLGAWIPILDPGYNVPEKFVQFGFNNILSLLLNTLAVGALFFGAMTFARRSKNRTVLPIAQVVFFIVFLAMLALVCLTQNPGFDGRRILFRGLGYFNLTELRVLGAMILIPASLLLLRPYGRYRFVAIGVALVLLWTVGSDEFYTLGVTISAFSLLLLFRASRPMVKGAAGIVLILFPFFLINLFHAGRFLTASLGRPTPAPFLARTSGIPRVVWIVFDEMSYDWAFSKRSPDVNLEEFDRLSRQALHASNAYPPSNYTLISMPALITGRFVAQVKPTGPADLLIQFGDAQEFVSFADQPNLFTRARELGTNSSLVGWYLPYDKLIGKDLSGYQVRDVRELGVAKSMFLHLKSPLLASPYAEEAKKIDRIKAEWERQTRLARFLELMEEAKKVAADSRYELTLIHLPIPHPPGLYRRANATYDANEESSYLDNLALADRSLGQLRRVMEEAGLWDESVVLVTSDHWWRTYIWGSGFSWTHEDKELVAKDDNSDPRVPFILKMPDQKTPLAYDSEFNTIVIHDLLLSILRNDLKNADEVVNWLDCRRSVTARPPYYRWLKPDAADLERLE